MYYSTLNSPSRRPNGNFFISLLSRPVNSGGRVTWSLAGEPCHAPFVDTQVSWDFCDVWRLNDCQITGLKNEIMEEITCLLLLHTDFLKILMRSESSKLLDNFQNLIVWNKTHKYNSQLAERLKIWYSVVQNTKNWNEYILGRWNFSKLCTQMRKHCWSSK